MGERGPVAKDLSQDIVDVLENNQRPFMGTGELSDAFGVSKPTMEKHLDRAVEKDDSQIKHTKVGNYNVWYLSELEQLGSTDSQKSFTVGQMSTPISIALIAIVSLIGVGLYSNQFTVALIGIVLIGIIGMLTTVFAGYRIKKSRLNA